MDTITADVTTDTTSQVADAAAVAQADAVQKLGWRSELPDTLKENEAFKQYATKNDLWKGHIELQTKVKEYEGKLVNAILKPGDNATDEQKAAYRAALGIPSKPDEYEGLDKPADWPVDVPYDPALSEAFKVTAAQLGVPKESAKGLFNWYNGIVLETVKQQQQAAKEATAKATETIKKEWGSDYDKNAATINKVVDGMKVSDADREWLRKQDNPVILKIILDAAPKYLNDNAAPGGTPIVKPTGGAIIYPDMPKT